MKKIKKFFLMAALLTLAACSQAPTAEEAPLTEIPSTEIPPTEIPPTEIPPTEIPPTPLPATAVPGELTVNTAILRGAINPLVYGSNTGPWGGLPPAGIEDFKNSGITFIRIPGGNWGDLNKFLPSQVDYMMDIVGMVDAEVLLHVNLLTGTVDDALELMRYAEENEYDIKYWSIGNEPTLYDYKPHITGWDTEYYNQQWREFAEAMKAQDPDIVLIGPDVHQFTANDETNPKDVNGKDWMREFLKANGDLVDVVSIHRYPFGKTNPTTDDLRQNSPEWDETIPFLRQMIQDETGRDLPIAVTEVNSNWNSTLGGEGTPDSYYNAIWWADSLGRMIFQDVDMVNYWLIYHTRDGMGFLGQNEVRPTYYVYQMYKLFGSEKLYADSGLEDVSIFAAQRDDGTVTLMIINRGDAVTGPLTIDGMEGVTNGELTLFDTEHQAESMGEVSLDELSLPAQSISLYAFSAP